MVAMKSGNLALSTIKENRSAVWFSFTSQSGLLCGLVAVLDFSLIQSRWVLSRLPGNVEVLQSLNLVC